ncbi:MAG TPA: hypothetical protein VJN92_19650 [Candidatus Acidoferrum sp.]|nr:hypothetical protein [Candidatus Acidoferrum sp.]
MKFGEQLAQAENLLKILGGKLRADGELPDLRGGRVHVGTEFAREGDKVSGTMSLQVGTQYWPGRLFAR